MHLGWQRHPELSPTSLFYNKKLSINVSLKTPLDSWNVDSSLMNLEVNLDNIKPIIVAYCPFHNIFLQFHGYFV